MEQQLILTEALAAEIRQLGDRYGIRNIRVFGSTCPCRSRPGK